MQTQIQTQAQQLKGKIGLEIHVYLVTKEKLFCRCKAIRKKGTTPNTYICPICTAQPGIKPMLPNRSAVEKAIQVGLMLNCKINEKLIWQRKHYSWPDLPKGYQNTLSGPKAFPVGINGNFYRIKIREMHLEEDPAAWNPETGQVDYNRSGFPLLEIVTEPDFSTAEEVGAWLKRLLHNLEYLKAVAPDSGIKADVNVNLPEKTERVEVKNVNSIEDIMITIEYELKRQLKEGSDKETRRFDSEKQKTIRMRGKEEAEDYRFISDPDLKPIIIDKRIIEQIKKTLPESPKQKLEKLIKKYKIGKTDAEVLAKNLDVAEFFEKVAEKIEPKFALHWITVELLRHLNYHKIKLDNIEIKPAHFIELLQLIKQGKITELQAKQVLNKFYPRSFSLSEEGVEKKIDSDKELEKICKEVLRDNKDALEKYRTGDAKIINFLIGEVMRKTNRRADFKITREIMENLLK